MEVTVKKPPRAHVSDYLASILKDEVCGQCPLCGKYENPTKGSGLTHHHINGDRSVSEYWNLLRICRSCHDEVEAFGSDDRVKARRMERKLLERKRALFRHMIGAAAYEVLLLACRHQVTSSLPCLAQTLLKLELVTVENPNPFNIGAAKHATIQDFRVTSAGTKLVEVLRLR